MVDSDEVESPKEDPTAEEWSCGFVVVAVTGFFRWGLWYLCQQPTRQSGVGTTLLQLQTKRHHHLGPPSRCPSQRSHFVRFYFSLLPLFYRVLPSMLFVSFPSFVFFFPSLSPLCKFNSFFFNLSTIISFLFCFLQWFFFLNIRW